MSKTVMHVSFAVFAVGHALVAQAQVFDTPTPQPNATVQPAGGPAAPQAGSVEQTGWGIPMPKITMPKITMPKVTMPSMDAVTAPFKSGYSKMKDGSKKAFDGAKEMLSFGKNSSTSTTINRASGNKKPSIWQKLIARPSEPQVPQTVGEFMSQPRLDP